jgi:glycosyltransferase involved in cell wall biosynthesis
MTPLQHLPRDTPLRVLSIAHSAVNRASGRVRYEDLAERRRDISLTLVAPDRWREYGRAMPLDAHSGPLDFRVARIRLPALPLVVWNCHHYVGLARILRDVRPQVLHLWEEPWSFVALQATRLRDRLLPDTALMLETDQNILRRLPPPFEQIRRYTLARTDLLIGRQPESLDVSRACGFRGPTAIVEYGVAAGIFAPQDRDGARKALGLDGLVLGYAGRVIPQKGLATVLDAMAQCGVAVSLAVLGSGPETERLVAQAERLGLRDRFRVLLPGPPAAVARFMNGLDAFVLMSQTMRTWKEQFGRVIMEAQACGVPVIGSDSGAIPGVVADGGWIVPEADPAALARLLARLANQPGLLRQAGEAGLTQARTRFSVSTVADCLADAYLRAAASRRRVSRPGSPAASAAR